MVAAYGQEFIRISSAVVGVLTFDSLEAAINAARARAKFTFAKGIPPPMGIAGLQALHQRIRSLQQREFRSTVRRAAALLLPGTQN